MKLNTIVILLLLFSNSYFAQGPVKPLSKSEDWTQSVDISGDLEVGLMYENFFPESFRSDFYVNIPNQNFSTLRVELISNDGHYFGKYEYNIRGLSGLINFQWTTSHLNNLIKYKCNHIAILAWVEDSSENKIFLPANWTSNIKPTNGYLLVNSEYPTYLNIYNSKTGDNNTQPCKLYNFDHGTAFSCFCEVNLDIIDEHSQFFVIENIDGERAQDEIYIKTK